MSSSYHLICASHNPAITIGSEWRSPHDALAAAATRNTGDAFIEHPACDLLVARLSGDWVEFACPGGDSCPYHRHDIDTWTDRGWLRLLHAAHRRGDDISNHDLPRCWTRDRVLRLGALLHVETTGEKP